MKSVWAHRRPSELTLAGVLLLAAASCASTEDGRTPSTSEVGRVHAAAESGEGVLRGPKGPPADPTALAEYPTKAEIDQFLAAYGDVLTWDEGDASFVLQSALPLQAELDQLVTLANFDSFAVQAASPEWAELHLASFVKFPNPAVTPLYTEELAEATFVSLSEGAPYTAYARKSQLPAEGSMLTEEEATALYEPKSSLDGLATKATTSGLQPKGGPLSETLREQVRARVRAQRYATACPPGMTAMTDYCIDTYEASVWTQPNCNGVQLGKGVEYPTDFPKSGNVMPGDRLYACSAEGFEPSRLITWFQANQACAAAGKRLCTNDEWQLAALGTPDTAPACSFGGNEITPQIRKSSAQSTCTSAAGVHDMAGNVAEWVDGWALGFWNIGPKWATSDDYSKIGPWPAGFGDGQDLVAGVSGTVRTNAVTTEDGLPAATIRGGSAADGDDAGAYYIHWAWSPAAARHDVGFRCCANRY